MKKHLKQNVPQDFLERLSSLWRPSSPGLCVYYHCGSVGELDYRWPPDVNCVDFRHDLIGRLPLHKL